MSTRDFDPIEAVTSAIAGTESLMRRGDISFETAQRGLESVVGDVNTHWPECTIWSNEMLEEWRSHWSKEAAKDWTQWW
jgi:hypothetical protein